MRSRKFVLDPNIYISYFISGNQHLLANIIIKYRIELVVCEELIAELKRVLNYSRLAKFKIDVKQAVKFLLTIGTLYELNYPIKHYLPEDRDDDYLIALALQTSAGFITSGDDDILSEKENLERKYKRLKILTKREFEQMFSE